MLKIRIVRFPESIADKLAVTSLKLEEAEVSIGRDAACGLVLPDLNRLVSRVHCTVAPMSGQWWLTVKSKANPVVIGHEELEFGQSRQLFDGDFIIICEFALQVERAEDHDSTQAFDVPVSGPNFQPSALNDVPVWDAKPQSPPPAWPAPGPFDDIWPGESSLSSPGATASSSPAVLPVEDEFDRFLTGQPSVAPVASGVADFPVMGSNHDFSSSMGNDPFGSFATSGGKDVLGLSNTMGLSVVDPHAVELAPTSGINTVAPIQALMPPTAYPAAARHEPVGVPSLFGGNPLPAAGASPPAAAPRTVPSAPLQASVLRQLLLEELGVDPARFAGIPDEELVRRVSVLLRESLGVVVKLLQLRMHLKQEVGAERTTMNPDVNNPLKFSPNVDVALSYVLGERMPGFMTYDLAIQEAAGDIVSHDSLLLNAGQNACKDLLRQLSPAVIEASVEQTGGLGAKIPVQRDAKAWGCYRQLHASCEANLDLTLRKAFR